MIEFSAFYMIAVFFFVYPPSVFVSSGLTVGDMCSSWLGSEDLQFVLYHMKRTSATVLVHSLLPAGFFAGLLVVEGRAAVARLLQHPFWWAVLMGALVAPLYVLTVLWRWKRGAWSRHPLARALAAQAQGRSWTEAAAEVDAEFRRIDKVTVSTNATVKVVITGSWILQVEPYKVHVAHQSRVSLSLEDAEHHQLTVDGPLGAQYLRVQVREARLRPAAGQPLFTIRLNALDYRDVQDRLQAPIDNVRGLVVHQDVHQRFVKVFTEQVGANEVYRTSDEPDSCLGCAVNRADTRLVRRCPPPEAADSVGGCTPCFCRPMWCVECLAKWFASRQDQERPETWLASRCPCPTCRNPFCLLDVSLVDYTQPI